MLYTPINTLWKSFSLSTGMYNNNNFENNNNNNVLNSISSNNNMRNKQHTTTLYNNNNTEKYSFQTIIIITWLSSLFTTYTTPFASICLELFHILLWMRCLIMTLRRVLIPWLFVIILRYFR